MCGISEVSRSSMVDPADRPGGRRAVTAGSAPSLFSGRRPACGPPHRCPAGRGALVRVPQLRGNPAA